MLAVHPDYASKLAHPLPPSGAATLDDRLSHAAVRRIAAKEHVFCEGDARDYVFRVEDGVIAVYKTLPDGRRQIIDFAYPGDLIGLGVLDEHVLSAQATTAAKVRCLSSTALERMAEGDATLALKLYKSVCQELAATRSLLVTVGQRSAIERVAAFLSCPASAHRRRRVVDGDARHAPQRHRRSAGPHHRDGQPHAHQAAQHGHHRNRAGRYARRTLRPCAPQRPLKRVVSGHFSVGSTGLQLSNAVAEMAGRGGAGALPPAHTTTPRQCGRNAPGATSHGST